MNTAVSESGQAVHWFSVKKTTKEEVISESVWAGRPCAGFPNDISASVERAGRALAFQHDSLAPVTCVSRAEFIHQVSSEVVSFRACGHTLVPQTNAARTSSRIGAAGVVQNSNPTEVSRTY